MFHAVLAFLSKSQFFDSEHALYKHQSQKGEIFREVDNCVERDQSFIARDRGSMKCMHPHKFVHTPTSHLPLGCRGGLGVTGG